MVGQVTLVFGLTGEVSVVLAAGHVGWGVSIGENGARGGFKMGTPGRPLIQ